MICPRVASYAKIDCNGLAEVFGTHLMSPPTEKTVYNVYCDESCHLENDHQGIMTFGAVWCPRASATSLAREVRALKAKHSARGELKWTKVSRARLPFYIELLGWFFAQEAMHFRGLVVLQKERLNHSDYNEGDPDLFYYKMQFSLLNKILSPDSCYAVYLDVKDTRSRFKVRKLAEVLGSNVYDFTSEMVRHIQNMHSHESELMQVADFLIGALSYKHRNIRTSAAKLAVVEHLEHLLGRSIQWSTPLREQKFNIFLFTPRGARS